MAKRKFTDDQLITATNRHHGDTAAAAKALGASRPLVCQRLAALPELPEIVLWARLRRPGRSNPATTRDTLAWRYRGLVGKIAKQIKASLPPRVRLDDLVSAGNVGLLDAINRFDHTRRLKFSTFANPRIRGAILDYLREIDPESRRTRSRQSKREQAEIQLLHALGRQPAPEEIQAHLGWDAATLAASYPTQRESFCCGDRTQQWEAEPPARPDAAALAQSSAISIAAATRGLPFEQRIVLYLHHAKRRTLKQIGEALCLSESRCSQLHTDALQWLRENHTKDELLEVLF